MTDEKQRLELLAPDYDAAVDFDRFMLRAFAEGISTRLHGRRVLDVGCSTGVTSEILADFAAELHVVDGSAQYIEAARSRLARFHHVVYHCSLFEEFEPQQRFDHIVCSHVLEHVVDPVGILRRVAMWLAPGGSIWVYVPNALSIHRRLGVAVGACSSVYDLSERDHRIGHRRVYDPASLASDIAKAGLKHGALGGVMMKPFTNAMMEKLDESLIQGLVKVGSELPEISSDIYYECFL